jgi:hypothetical protein
MTQKNLAFLILSFLSIPILGNPDSGDGYPKNTERLFTDPKFNRFNCSSPLKLVEKKRGNEVEVACQDSQGKLQGPAMTFTQGKRKTGVYIYKDNEITDERTVNWDETGKIFFTVERNTKTFWYDFKKQKKRVETVINDARKETRQWYATGILQSLTVEEFGHVTQVLGWDEKGNRLGGVTN